MFFTVLNYRNDVIVKFSQLIISLCAISAEVQFVKVQKSFAETFSRTQLEPLDMLLLLSAFI